MAEFLKLLAVYYMCDAAAMERHLTQAELVACTETYEQVKHYFTGFDDGPLTLAELAARKRDAYAGFKAWEADNAVLVAELKAAAKS